MYIPHFSVKRKHENQMADSYLCREKLSYSSSFMRNTLNTYWYFLTTSPRKLDYTYLVICYIWQYGSTVGASFSYLFRKHSFKSFLCAYMERLTVGRELSNKYPPHTEQSRPGASHPWGMGGMGDPPHLHWHCFIPPTLPEVFFFFFCAGL